MKLKGDWSSLVTYDVGNVVRYTDGNVYHLQKPCKAGVPPVNTLYWGRADELTSSCALFALDAVDMAIAADVALQDDLTQETAGKKALDAHQGYVLKGMIPDNINAEAITLKDSSDNEYLITVDASGDTPELTVTLITPEVEEGAET